MLVFLDTDVIPKLKVDALLHAGCCANPWWQEQAESIKRDMLTASQAGPQLLRLGEMPPPIRAE